MKRRVAANIAAALTDSGLTVAEVARRTGNHERAIRRWRDGDVSPSQKNLARLASVVGVQDVTWFYLPHEDEQVAA